MKTIRTLLAIGAATVACHSASATPTEWKVSDGGNGHTYEVIVRSSSVSWDQAQAIAESKGGYLATLTSAAENAFVFALASPDVVPEAWIGGAHDLGPWLGGYQRPGSAEPAGGWQWVNGEGDFLYTDWAYGEPNDGLGAHEQWLHFYKHGSVPGTWNDISQNIWHLPSLVVEVSSPVPEPETFALMLAGLGVLGFAARRRQPG